MKKLLQLLILATLILIPNSFLLANNNTPEPDRPPQVGQQYTMLLKNRNAVAPSQGIFEIKPGGQTSNTLLVKNLSTIPLKFSLYTVDEQKTPDGKFAVEMREDPKDTFGLWAQITPSYIDVKPNEVQPATLTINIPADQESKTYLGGFVIEKEAEKTAQEGIMVATRIAAKSSITVTPTPYAIPLLASLYNHPPAWKAFFLQYYFYISLALFIGAMIFLGLATKAEKKKRKK